MRGDLYRLKAPRDSRGHEQAGQRYAAVLQSDDLPLSTWVIAPTSTGRRETRRERRGCGLGWASGWCGLVAGS